VGLGFGHGGLPAALGSALHREDPGNIPVADSGLQCQRSGGVHQPECHPGLVLLLHAWLPGLPRPAYLLVLTGHLLLRAHDTALMIDVTKNPPARSSYHARRLR
jgi:hypothetical protein